MHISKEFNFEAAHQLPPDKECTYGICSRLHGHSYRIRVAVQGLMNADKWIIDFKKLSDIVRREVIDVVDHQFLNEIYPGEVTTAENLGLIWAKKIQQALEQQHPGVDVHSLEVWETQKCCAVIEAQDIKPSAPNP